MNQNIIIKDEHGRYIKYFIYWKGKENQKIVVKGLKSNNLPIFHFANSKSKESIAVNPIKDNDKYIVEIPSEALAEGNQFYVYITIYADEENGRGLNPFVYPIVRMPPPVIWNGD